MNSIRASFPAPRQLQAGPSLPGPPLAAGGLAGGAPRGLGGRPPPRRDPADPRRGGKIGSSGANTPRDVQSAFDRFAAVDDIRSISGKDLAVERMPDGTMSVSFQYEKRIPLYGPASLVIDYQGSNRVR